MVIVRDVRPGAMADESNLMSLDEAAVRLRVSKVTLRRWTKSGMVSCVRIGSRGDRRFRREDIECFIDHMRRDAIVREPAYSAERR
jgi:excisionase family DNA binding protein